MTRTFSQLGASGSSTGSSVAVTLSYPAFSTQFFVPKTANGSLTSSSRSPRAAPQAITATARMANGTPGIPGTVVVMTAKHAAMGVNQSMFAIGVNTLVGVPLSDGKAGMFDGTFTVTGALHTITVNFYAWTPRTLALHRPHLDGPGAPERHRDGLVQPDAVGGGTVTLVSPSKVSIDGSSRSGARPRFTKLVLSFVPEPSTLLLLGAGALALALANRRRRRPSHERKSHGTANLPGSARSALCCSRPRALTRGRSPTRPGSR